MKIGIYSIEKNQAHEIKGITEGYLKMSKKYADIEEKVIFNKQIAKAQVNCEKKAKEEYSKVYEPYLEQGYSICLDVKGELVDSFEFANLLKDKPRVNFFIGGAFGFEEDFLSKSQKVISLSNLTFAHKIAKLVLYEQIYRGLSILNAHPYHK